MCWSMEASVAMTCLGVGAAAVTYHRNDPPAIWLTLGYFSAMEALQVGGYIVLDQCDSTANQAITLISYLHIVFQPFFINAFAMELVPATIKSRVRTWVYLLCGLSAVIMLMQLMPLDFAGPCATGAALCARELCTVSGEWHIAWNIPYNGLLIPLETALGINPGFPSYMIVVFLLPLVYGAWRFVVLHAVTGPILAHALTDNPNEMPAIWCLFSIFILLIGLSTRARQKFSANSWWGRNIKGAS